MDRLLTKTLAEIYLRQGHLQEAYDIFKALSERNPSDGELQNRLKELEEKLVLSSPEPSRLDPYLEKKIHRLAGWLNSIRNRKTR